MKNYLPILLLLFSILSCATQTRTQVQTPKAKLSPKLVRWGSDEGISRLERSKYKVDFFKLANNFTSQNDGVLCGPTTGALVLNALRIRSNHPGVPKTYANKQYTKHIPKKWKWDPRLSKYTASSFINNTANKTKKFEHIYGKPIKGKVDIGLQLRQLYNLFLDHKVKSQLRIVSNNLETKTIKKELIKNLATANNYVVVNYARKSLGQKGGGHISPLGAYDQQSDSFLILDVNPNKDDWVWVNSEDLIDAMRTFDTIENRGYIHVSN